MPRRALVVIVGVVVIALAIAVWRRSASPPSNPPRALAGSSSPGSPASAAGAPAASDSSAPVRPGEGPVRRLTGDERRRLGEQIAAARQRARQAAVAGSSSAGSADDDVIPVEQAGKPLQDGLTAAIPILAACYEQQAGGDATRDAAALMTMTSDPELGTVIDTDDIKDGSGEPLAAKLDECLRDAIDSLALPPLARGGKLKLKYTFRFD